MVEKNKMKNVTKSVKVKNQEEKPKIDLSIKGFLLPKISQEGVVIVAIFFVVAFLLMLASKVVGMLAMAVALFAFYFFRDPERVMPEADGLIIAPADGRLLPIQEGVSLPEELGEADGKYIKFSIFMSVFNVHVNRNPVSGVVRASKYIEGKFFNADLDKASKDNERNLVLVETKEGDNVCYVQIAGLVARRIVSRLEEGDSVEQGKRFGLIKFGSRLDVYLPQDKYEVKVMAGQIIVGCETILAVRKK